jgi:hypothetical protein
MTTKDSGIVNIHGKEYFTVAKRIGMLREGEWKHCSLVTEIIHRDENCVVMKATILNDAGRVMATGHSEEYRADGKINATSALENSETSAIGRALAALGLGGTEFASADEVAHAISGKSGVIKPTDGAMQRVDPKRRTIVADTATLVRDYLAEDKDFDAFALCEDFTDPDEKVYLWTFFDSKQRARIKAQAEASKQKRAA